MRLALKTLWYWLCAVGAWLWYLPTKKPPVVAVLLYHSFGREGWKYSVTPEALTQQLSYVKAHFDIVPLAQVVEYAKGARDFSRDTLAISIDDGYRDTYTEFFLRAQALGISFTLFLTSDLAPQEKMGHLSRPSWSEIKEMHESGLVSIEVHGKTHTNFPEALQAGTLEAEVCGCASDIAAHIGVEPSMVAYPSGRHNKKVRSAIASLGFAAGFAAHDGHITKGGDLFALPRVVVHRDIPFTVFTLRLTHVLLVHTWLSRSLQR